MYRVRLLSKYMLVVEPHLYIIEEEKEQEGREGERETSGGGRIVEESFSVTSELPL